MKASQFVEYVIKEFGFLISDYKFRIERIIQDDLVYGVQYKSDSRAVQVSFEVLDQFASVMIFRLKGDEVPSRDDTDNAHPLHKLSQSIHAVNEVDESILPPLYDKETYKQNPVLKDLNKKARSLKRISKYVLVSNNWLSFPEIDKPQPPKIWNFDDD